jgi:3-hydroxy-9,10-secoandrosta-1,3,5(10)-triene-9,17-dione monooxygenase reductase component
MNEGFGRIHYEDPFVTPIEAREPIRRLRGRLAATVTVWTSGAAGSPVGLTMSSVVVAEGRPSVVFGLMNDTTELWEAVHATGAFVVHVLEEKDRTVANKLAGLWPSPRGPFSGLEVEPSEWGPVIASIANRAYCRFELASEAGYQRLVKGAIERIELAELGRPLVYFRGRYRPLGHTDPG